MKTDRRIQKTKKLLSEALIELILKKGYDNVTVQDILDKANVGRSTFYSHYENKELLLIDGPRNLGHSFFDEAQGLFANEQINFLSLFRHVGENRLLAKAMFGKKSGDIFLEAFKAQIASFIKNQYKHLFSNAKKDRLILQYLSMAASAAFISLLVSWVDDDLEITTEEISQHASKVVKSIFKGM